MTNVMWQLQCDKCNAIIATSQMQCVKCKMPNPMDKCKVANSTWQIPAKQPARRTNFSVLKATSQFILS